MQYQVFNKQTREVVAWIDTNSDELVLHKDYDIRIGKDLSAIEEESNNPKAVAKFEEISLKQCLLDLNRYGYDDSYQIVLPIRKTKGSAGYDFLAPRNFIIPPFTSIIIPTGIKCQIDEGYVLELYPRSSLGFKYNLTLDNTVGIIDSDYYNNENNEGHILCKMTNHSKETIVIEQGEAFMQGIFKEYFITKDDKATGKRVGGIGSTNS